MINKATLTTPKGVILLSKKGVGMKAGANRMDVVKIQKLYVAGLNALQISKKLNINVKTVKSFQPEEAATPKVTGTESGD